MSTAFIFPGQGSQAVGMCSQLAEEFASVKLLFEQASDALGVDLWAMTQEGPADQLGMTENTQPALLTAGVAAWQVWRELGGAKPTVMAGHSLGEYTALVCAGALGFEDAVTLVRDRGRYMQAAVPAGEGGMAAILGLEDDAVREVCQQAAGDGVLEAVNFNAPGQVVIAGSAAAIERGAEVAKAAGAKRAMPLPVSIPAHSSLMSSATEKLAARIDQVDVSTPDIPVIHNVNVEIASSADEIKGNLINQLDSPVRWVETVQTMKANNVERTIESGPGKVLCGMVKRIDRGITTAAIDTPDALRAALA